MFRIIYFILILSLFSQTTQAQLNTALRSNVPYGVNVNDVWGYEAGGREYALVGLQNGVNIQDVTDPTMPVDLGTATGISSGWRDMKTFGDYAYVSNEAGSGIMVIDLSNLPTPITAADYSNWQPTIGGTTLSTCHNLYIDGTGYLYLAGTNINSGGVLYADVFTNPGNPVYVDQGLARYAHDVYVDGNTMYASEINQGKMAIYNITNKSNTILLGEINTPFNFTHNIWTNGNIAYTTDERANAPTAAYDVSVPGNIELLDEFKPLGSIGTGVVPHNVHVINNHLVISHYSDGVVIVDATDPCNLIEVGNYDTYTGGGTGGNGAWGAFPFLPSGNILVSDRWDGLFVITPTYVDAARLKGQVTDLSTGNPIPGVAIDITNPLPNEEESNITGNYKTGIAAGGTFDVTISKAGYVTQVISVTFINGVDVTLNVQLVSTSLPIEISTFELEKVGSKQVKLHWDAVANHDQFNFIIEASNDGVNYKEIDQIIQTGIAGITQSFEYHDRTEHSKKVYYRIKLIDPDRSFKYSEIRSMDFNTNFVDQIRMFPNPVVDAEYLNINIPKTSDKIFVRILNASGQVVYNEELRTGEINLIPGNQIAKGLNLVVIDGNAGVLKTERIVR